MYYQRSNRTPYRSNNRHFTNNRSRGGNGNRGVNPQVSRQLVEAIQKSKLKKQSATPFEEKKAIHASFNDFPIAEELKRNISFKNYAEPTPIQDQTIPHILQGKDLIGIANTGTGKTAAYLIPLIQKVLTNRNERVFILAPTRELAFQIQDELRSFTKGMGIYSALCIGGTSMYQQRSDLRKNSNFVIGTPGRIKDLTRTGSLNLSLFHSVVLDEADRMVDIGFINDIKYFITFLPKDRQSLFFSATISRKEEEIIYAFVQNPVTVSVKKQETAENINQEMIKVISREKKIEQLHDLLIDKKFQKILIFGRTKWGIQKLTDELVNRGFKAGSIHGNKSQSQRQRVLDQFKRDEISILLATDVASRGLDIDNVSHVINYEIPSTYEDYVHRIGRTGRANQQGIALTFID